MASHKSAEKRARQNEKKRVRNKAVRTRVKHATKEVRLTAAQTSKEEALAKLRTAQSVINKALKKGVIHKKTAARKISRLSRLVNSMVLF